MSKEADTHNPSMPPAPPSPRAEGSRSGPPAIDVRERGAERNGEPQVLDQRLFMQLLAFRVQGDASAAAQGIDAALRQHNVPSVLYADVNDPRGLALLTWSEDPADFVTKVRPLFENDPVSGVLLRPELTMLGRTYSSGHEPDLRWWLLDRPRETVLNEAWPWAIWYPLRRSGSFAQLEEREQGRILREHAVIGHAYGTKDLAHDIRLACHGLDANDNEFVIGLVGKDLHPLSHIVQTMRRTRQTSEFISQMGPFFVGRVLSRSAGG